MRYVRKTSDVNLFLLTENSNGLEIIYGTSPLPKSLERTGRVSCSLKIGDGMKFGMRSEENKLTAQENTYQSLNEGRLKYTVTVGRYANMQRYSCTCQRSRSTGIP